MSKKAKILIIVFIVLLIAAGLTYYFLKVRKKPSKDLGPEVSYATQNTTSSSTVTGASLNLDKLLDYGSTGEEVKQLQAWLNDYYNAGLVEDGQLGNNTRRALNNIEINLPISLKGFAAKSIQNAGSSVLGWFGF